MKTLAIIAALVLFTNQSFSAFYDGNWLVSRVNNYERANSGNKKDFTDKDDIIKAYVEAVEFSKYISGVFDGVELRESFIRTAITTDQLCAVVINYLRNHPERWGEGANVLIYSAVSEAWPGAGK